MADSPGARHRRGAALVVLVATTALACSGERPTLAEDATPTSRGSSTTSSSASASTDDRTEIATAEAGEIAIYADIDGTEPERTLAAAEAVAAPEQTPLVFLVRAQRAGRLLVYLPVPPPGATGWIDDDDVAISSTRFRVVVSLSEHRLQVFDVDETVLDEPVAVGSDDRPEPGNDYFLKELLRPPDPSGPYGSYAYGLSGYVNGVEALEAGSGLVGLHGTNDPSQVGEDAAVGSVAVANDVIERLAEDIGVPLGTPVEIRR